MSTFIEQARAYAENHQKPITLYTHVVGIPLIFFGLMIFLGFFQLVVPRVLYTTLAEIGTILLLIYYIKLSWRLGLMAAPFIIFLLWLSHFVSSAGPTRFAIWTFLIVTVVGWALQLLGHVLEGRGPAFQTNYRLALAAPLFLIVELCFRAGYLSSLKQQIHPDFTGIPPVRQDDVL